VCVYFVIDPLKVEVISRILISFVHPPDAFRCVSDIQEDVGAMRATHYTLIANLK
jgi:hypothetical protein